MKENPHNRLYRTCLKQVGYNLIQTYKCSLNSTTHLNFSAIPEPSGPPVEVKATNITPHSITILWQPPVILDANGVIVGYMLKITVSSSRETTRTVELTRPFYTISGAMRKLYIKLTQ